MEPRCMDERVDRKIVIARRTRCRLKLTQKRRFTVINLCSTLQSALLPDRTIVDGSNLVGRPHPPDHAHCRQLIMGHLRARRSSAMQSEPAVGGPPEAGKSLVDGLIGTAEAILTLRAQPRRGN